jgi:hypothetical protein
MDKKYFTVYKMTIPTCPKGNIWGITSFRMGLNELLKESNLKTTIIGGRELKRDSNPFLSSMSQV